MKPALCVFPIMADINEAFNKMYEYIHKASALDCDLIVFPEACPTGLEITGIPNEDIKHGRSIDSPEIQKIRDIAAIKKIHVAFGWLELAGNTLFDSVIMIDDEGHDLLHYRRISAGWFDERMDHEFYHCGVDIVCTDTKLGKVTVLICGDLFTDGLPERVKELNPDIVLYPFARAFTNLPAMQMVWETEELPFYLNEWKKFNGTVLAVNSIEAPSTDSSYIYCGGAWIMNEHGHFLSSKPLMEEGLLTLS